VYKRCRGIGYLHSEELHFARSYCQTLRRNFLCFRNVTGLRKASYYLLSQIGNTDETSVYFDMPSNYTVDETGIKSVLIKMSGNKKMRVTIMLMGLADGTELPTHVILHWKSMPEKQLPAACAGCI
jgi:hypothetical protein